MSQLKNDRLLRTIWREPVDATPIWIMRQAGRYLPEYRATREKAGSFIRLCKTPELACEVTLQPLNRFALDAAILFSDILTIPDAMGLGLEFIEGKGPHFSRPIQSPEQIARLSVPDLEELRYVYDAIQLIQQELAGKVPLIGFCGSPWTLASYIVEGKSQAGFPKIQQLMQSDPFLLHSLLDILAKSVCAHLNEQIVAGVNVVMIFDTWGGLLNAHDYQEFSLFYIQQIIQGLIRNYNDNKIPIILFTKSGHRFLEQMANCGCDVLGVDWEISLHDARARVGDKVALQGNMNPNCLLEQPAVVRETAIKILASYGKGSGHIFNLGHGITPDIAPEQVALLVDTVHEMSKPYHAKMSEKIKE